MVNKTSPFVEIFYYLSYNEIKGGKYMLKNEPFFVGIDAGDRKSVV